MAWLESSEALLQALAALVRFTLETLSVLCVVGGVIATFRLAWPFPPSPRRLRRRSFSALRLSFGSWLSMALEFQLGADIVATTTAPTGQNLIQLAVVAVIRTFLNLFLAREIEAEQRLEARRAEAQPPP